MTEAIKTAYDTLTINPCRGDKPASWYLNRWKRRKGLLKTPGAPGRGRIEKFRRISQYQGVTPKDIIEGRLPRVFESEYHFYRWNVGPILCVYCGCRLTRDNKTQDHVIPKARGGAFLGRNNLEPCCRDCNSDKSDQSVLEFLVTRAR